MSLLFALLYWAFVAGTSALLFPVALLIRIVAGPFDRNGSVLHHFTRWWAQLYVRCLPGSP